MIRWLEWVSFIKLWILSSLTQQLCMHALWVCLFTFYSTCVGTESSLDAVEVTLGLGDSQLHHWAEVHSFTDVHVPCGCMYAVVILICWLWALVRLIQMWIDPQCDCSSCRLLNSHLVPQSVDVAGLFSSAKVVTVSTTSPDFLVSRS